MKAASEVWEEGGERVRRGRKKTGTVTQTDGGKRGQGEENPQFTE